MKRALFLTLAVLALLGVLSKTAFAENPRVEAAGKLALRKAEDDYLRTEFEQARKRLQAAERACGERNCTPQTRAGIIRDIGVMQFRLGSREGAIASFRRAKKIDPNVALNPSYETQDLRDAWAETTPLVQPVGGDFTHKPAAAQAIRVPLPVYVEATTTEPIASVVVRYRNDSMTSYRRARLSKRGQGWGGYIPCADVVSDNVRYYIQGFDKDGELVASSGDPDHPFTVPIRESVAEPPLLPGETAPRGCGDEQLESPKLSEGERCLEDRQCRTGSCSEGVCRAPPANETEDTGALPGFARLWIGVAGSLDLAFPPSQSDVCVVNGGASTSSYWCTTPSGDDYPGNTQLVAGRGGQPDGGLTPGGAHVTLTIDYAVSPSILLGVRVGYVIGAYPGTFATNNGKTIGPPLHAEIRGTYLLGDEPLTSPGLAPYLFASAGVARFDAPQTVQVAESKVAGERAVQAWFVAGPVFVEAGGGARYAFSQRIAASIGLGVNAAIGPGAFAVSAAPEMQIQYGF
jgi:hypothetical protein